MAQNLYDAARTGQVSRVNELFPSADEDEKSYAFFGAVEADQAEVTEYFVDHGVKLEDSGRPGCSPLMRAVQHEATLVAESLLKRGADPDFPNEKGETALWYTIMYDMVELLELLLRQPTIRFRNTMRCSPSCVYPCILKDKAKLLGMLLDASPALVTNTDEYGFRPLEFSNLSGLISVHKSSWSVTRAVWTSSTSLAAFFQNQRQIFKSYDKSLSRSSVAPIGSGQRVTF